MDNELLEAKIERLEGFLFKSRRRPGLCARKDGERRSFDIIPLSGTLGWSSTKFDHPNLFFALVDLTGIPGPTCSNASERLWTITSATWPG